MNRIERDYRGLDIAAGELLEAALARTQLKASEMAGRNVKNSAAVARSFSVALTLADGYYDRAAYLFDLAELIEQGLDVSRLKIEQLRGVRSVLRARQEFSRKHPACPHCGEPLGTAAAFTCWSCKQPIKRAV